MVGMGSGMVSVPIFTLGVPGRLPPAMKEYERWY